MDFYNNFENYLEGDFYDVTSYIMSLINGGNLITFFDFMNFIRRNIDFSQKLEKNSNNNLDSEEQAFFEARTEKIKAIWEYINDDDEVVENVVDRINDMMEYNPDDDESRLFVVSELIEIVNRFPRFYRIDEEQKRLYDRWAIAKEKIANIICQIEPEDYLLVCNSIDTQESFFSDDIYFKATKFQLENMTDAHFVQFLLDTKNVGAQSFSMYEIEWELNESLYKDRDIGTSLMQAKIQRAKQSKSPFVADVFKEVTGCGNNEPMIPKQLKNGKTERLYEVRSKLEKLYITELFLYDGDMNDYGKKRAEEVKEMENSESYKKYESKLLNSSDLEFMEFIMEARGNLVSLYGREPQIFKDKLSNLSKQDFLVILINQVSLKRINLCNNFFYDEAKRRGLIKDEVNSFFGIKLENINVPKSDIEMANATGSAIKNLLDNKMYLPHKTIRLDLNPELNSINTESEESEHIYEELMDEYLNKSKQQNQYISIYNYINNLSLLPDKEFLGVLNYLYNKCTINQKNAESYGEDNSNDFDELSNKAYKEYIISLVKKRILDIDIRYIGILYKLYNSNSNSEFSEIIRLYIEHTQKELMKDCNKDIKHKDDISKNTNHTAPDEQNI